MQVLVTAALGNVGRELVPALQRRQIGVKAADRDPAEIGSQLGGGVESVRLDFTERASFAPALAGCSGLFLLRPPAIANVEETLIPLLEEAHARGIEHVVFLSVAGAERNRWVPHHAVEQHLLRGPMSWSILRPGFFAQNLGGAYRTDILERGRLYVPAGRGRVAFVDLFDVAEVAALCFSDPKRHRGQAYTLTGPRAVDFAEVADLLSHASGRPIRYEPASLFGYVRHLSRRGLPLGQVAVQTVLHAGLRFGQAEQVDPTLERLLGRPGRDIAQYIEEHRRLWTNPQHGQGHLRIEPEPCN
jgi:uncharacterized protein YbjT (DUF2867 family)